MRGAISREGRSWDVGHLKVERGIVRMKGLRRGEWGRRGREERSTKNREGIKRTIGEILQPNQKKKKKNIIWK